MKKYSAAEAIGPAWEHTQAVMLQPFRLGRYLKLGFVALLAQMASSGVSIGIDGVRGANAGMTAMHLPTPSLAPLIGLIAIGVMFVILVSLLLFYISSRMQFVFFDVIARKADAIGALWSRNGSRTWRWIGLKLLVALGSMIVMGLLMLATLPFLIGVFSRINHGEDSSNVVSQVGAGIVISFIALLLGIIVIAIVFAIIHALLHDFTLPYMALEDLSIGSALRRLEIFIKDSPGELTLYLLLKLALSIAFALAAEIIYVIVLMISLIPFAIVYVPLYFLLHNHGTGAMVLFIAAAVLGGLALLAWIFILSALTFGYVYAFLQSYALYFMGGRYQLLGDLLEPPQLPPTEPTTVTA